MGVTLVHERFADRIVTILRVKKIEPGPKAAKAYINRVCKGAPPEIWALLKGAQERAKGWDMGLNKT
jgi:hypothetical protein